VNPEVKLESQAETKMFNRFANKFNLATWFFALASLAVTNNSFGQQSEYSKKLGALNCIVDVSGPCGNTSGFRRIQGYWIEYHHGVEFSRFKELEVVDSGENLIFYAYQIKKNQFLRIEKQKNSNLFSAYWSWVTSSIENTKWQSIPGSFIPVIYDYPLSDKTTDNFAAVSGQLNIGGKLRISTPSGETWGSRVANAFNRHVLPSTGPGNTYNSQRMWHSAYSPSGWVSLDLEFPMAVNLTRIRIHSQHSGVNHAAVGARVFAMGQGDFRLLTEQPLASADAEVPFTSTSSKFWRVDLKAGQSGEVLLRGMKFFSGSDELVFEQ